ncbi:cell division cycle 14 [Carabus blaptoides fortunei]
MSNTTDDLASYPPWNFSWVVESKLAALAWPQTSANVRFLHEQGIHYLITLSPEKRPPITDILFDKISWIEIGIEEFEAPSVKQIQQFIDVCEKANLEGESVGVHCRMGLGRTGVMAACYLVHFYGQSPERAIINVRLMRPGSVETQSQERAVMRYHDHLRGLHVME